MNKQEIENKLEEIYENYVGDDRALPSVVKEGLKIAFNLALELAYQNVELLDRNGESYNNDDVTVDKQSILNLKL